MAGMAFDAVNLIAREAGYTPTNSLVTRHKALAMLTTGTVDMVCLPPDSDVGEGVVSLGPVFTVDIIAVARAGSALRSMKDMRGKRVAVVRDAPYHQIVSRKNGMIPYLVKDMARGLKLLVSGQVECVVGTRAGVLFGVSGAGLPKRALGHPLLLSQGEVILFLSRRAASTPMRQRIAEALARLRQNEDFARLLVKYML